MEAKRLEAAEYNFTKGHKTVSVRMTIYSYQVLTTMGALKGEFIGR